MKKLLPIIVLIFFATVANAVVREDSDTVLKTVEKTYTVQYPSGGSDNFIYVFTAHLKAYMAQHGESSSWKHPVDSRRCNYSVSSYILREGFYVTGSGKRVPEGALKKMYGPKQWRRKGNTIFEQVIGKHSPCNDYVGDFNSIKKSISRSILNTFDAILLQDVIPGSEADAKSILKASAFTRTN